MSDCDHSFSGDDICNSCGYSIGYLLINAEQEIAALKAEREAIISTIDKRNLVVVNEDDANLWYSGVSQEDDWPEGFHCEDPISAELDRLRAEDGAADVLIARQRDLLTGVANALKGPPEELSTHSHHDLPEIAATLQANLAAAREEIERAPVCVGYVKKSDAKYMPQINQEMVLIVKGLGLLCPENGYQPIYIDPPECNAFHKSKEG